MTVGELLEFLKATDSLTQVWIEVERKNTSILVRAEATEDLCLGSIVIIGKEIPQC